METKNGTKMAEKKNEDVWIGLSAVFARAILPPPEKKGSQLDDYFEEIINTTPKPMRPAVDVVCVPDRWMQTSVKGQYETGLAALTKEVKAMKQEAKKEEKENVDTPLDFLPALIKAVETSGDVSGEGLYTALISALVRKAFFHPEKEDETFDETNFAFNDYQQYAPLLGNLFSLPRREKTVIACALYILYALCSDDEVGAALTRVSEHMTVCVPGQQQGVDYLYTVVGVKLQAMAGAVDVEEDDAVVEDVHEADEDEDEEDILEMDFYQYCHERVLGTEAQGVTPTRLIETLIAPTKEEKVLRRKFEGYFQDYLDDHKERALLSGVIEPAKYVLTCSGQGIQHMEINGRSWYLVAMEQALTASKAPITAGGGHGQEGEGRVAFPVPINEDDRYQIGVIHPYGNLTAKAARVFQTKTHFGKGWEGIQDLKEKAGYRKVNRVTRHQNTLTWQSYSRPSHVRDVFVEERKHDLPLAIKDKDYRPTDDVRQWAVMAEHLAFFFSRDFFVPKCFETLNGETKPEYVGFRQCCVELFQFYKKAPEFVKPQRPQADQDQDEEPEELDQDGEFYAHCYEDEYYTKLDLESVTRFFSWLGVVKPQGTYTTTLVVDDRRRALEQEDERDETWDKAEQGVEELEKTEEAAWGRLFAWDRRRREKLNKPGQQAKDREYTQGQQRRAALRKELKEKARKAKELQQEEEVHEETSEFDLFAVVESEVRHVAIAGSAPVAGGGGCGVELEEVEMERFVSTESMGMLRTTSKLAMMWDENARSTSFEG